MGVVKRDVHKKEREHDVEFAYQPQGIERLLSDVHRIEAMETYKGDLGATVLRIDLEAALRSRCLTPRQRQVVALYYFAELTQTEAAGVLGVSQQAVDARIKSVWPALSAHMSGEPTSVSQFTNAEIEGDTPLDRWMADAAMNEGEWWRLTDEVIAELNRRFPPPDVVSEDAEDGEEYPVLSEGAMFYRGKQREVACAEIYRQYPHAGFMRSSEDGRRIRIPEVS